MGKYLITQVPVCHAVCVPPSSASFSMYLCLNLGHNGNYHLDPKPIPQVRHAIQHRFWNHLLYCCRHLTGDFPGAAGLQQEAVAPEHLQIKLCKLGERKRPTPEIINLQRNSNGRFEGYEGIKSKSASYRMISIYSYFQLSNQVDFT